MIFQTLTLIFKINTLRRERQAKLILYMFFWLGNHSMYTLLKNRHNISAFRGIINGKHGREREEGRRGDSYFTAEGHGDESTDKNHWFPSKIYLFHFFHFVPQNKFYFISSKHQEKKNQTTLNIYNISKWPF